MRRVSASPFLPGSRSFFSDSPPVPLFILQLISRLTGRHPYQLITVTASMADTAIVVFARHPTPGKVKTRLAKDTGNDAATQFYKICAEHVIRQVSRYAMPHMWGQPGFRAKLFLTRHKLRGLQM